MRDHPDPKLLERFMRGEASALERRSIVRHMLAGCLQCLQITRPLWRFGDVPLIPIDDGGPEHEEEQEGHGGEDGEDRAPAAEGRGAGSRLTR
jgi:hypothetical protein